MQAVRRVLALSLLIFLAVIVSRAANQQRETSTNKAGQALYKQRCAACHEGAVPRAPNRAALEQISRPSQA